jgi:hypothetical protein
MLYSVVQFREPLERDYPNVGIAVAKGQLVLVLVLGPGLHK